MKGRPTAVCFDLDSTLAHTGHRQYLIPLISDGKASWEDYAALCPDDMPMTGVLEVMRLLWPYHEVHIVSGRSASAEEQTRAWFTQHGYDGYYDYLSLRQDANTPSNGAMKAAYLWELRRSGVMPVVFFEDHLSIAEVITDTTGVPVVLVNPGYEWIEAARPGSQVAG